MLLVTRGRMSSPLLPGTPPTRSRSWRLTRWRRGSGTRWRAAWFLPDTAQREAGWRSTGTDRRPSQSRRRWKGQSRGGRWRWSGKTSPPPWETISLRWIRVPEGDRYPGDLQQTDTWTHHALPHWAGCSFCSSAFSAAPCWPRLLVASMATAPFISAEASGYEKYVCVEVK